MFCCYLKLRILGISVTSTSTENFISISITSILTSGDNFDPNNQLSTHKYINYHTFLLHYFDITDILLFLRFPYFCLYGTPSSYQDIYNNSNDNNQKDDIMVYKLYQYLAICSNGKYYKPICFQDDYCNFQNYPFQT